MRAKKNF